MTIAEESIYDRRDACQQFDDRFQDFAYTLVGDFCQIDGRSQTDWKREEDGEDGDHQGAQNEWEHSKLYDRLGGRETLFAAKKIGKIVLVNFNDLSGKGGVPVLGIDYRQDVGKTVDQLIDPVR